MSCPLCKEENGFRELFKLDDRLWFSESRFSLVRCAGCRFVFLNPAPSGSELEKHYPPAYHGPPSEERPDSFKWRHSRITAHKKGGKILDVGCSNGAFIHFMQGRGWDVYGLDNAPQAVGMASTVLGERVRLGSLLDVSCASEEFDVVSLFEVLEHLPDLIDHFDEFHRILKPDGLLCFTVPNFGSWESRMFGQWWNGLDAPRHLYQFSKETVRRFLTRSGFDRINIVTTNAHHIQIGKSRIDYCQQSLRFYLRERGLYPPMPGVPAGEGTAQQDAEPSRNALLKKVVHAIESCVFYPLWLFGRMIDSDNTLWVTARRQ